MVGAPRANRGSGASANGASRAASPAAHTLEPTESTEPAESAESAEPATRPRLPPRLATRFRGCFLGGALGDALGAAVEFDSLAAIRRQHGARGVTGMLPAYGRLGAITDDTQMTLFTAEGLIRAWVRGKTRGIGYPPSVVRHAYLRWLHTQGVPWQRAGRQFYDAEHRRPDGWLVGERWLHARRAPGNTCLSALEAEPGERLAAINDSKGCGGVMRIAPVGLMSHAGTGSEATPLAGIFRLGVEIAALTHGHPTGQLAAGVLAATIHGIVHGGLPLEAALDEALRELRSRPSCDETLLAVERARALVLRGDPSPEAVESLGGGWIAEEALAIAAYCALSHPDDLRAALLLAVNHSGDSDSTGAICGHLLGASLGFEALPREWLEVVEGRETIERLADDLLAEDQDLRPKGSEFETEPGFEEWWGRYPGW